MVPRGVSNIVPIFVVVEFMAITTVCLRMWSLSCSQWLLYPGCDESSVTSLHVPNHLWIQLDPCLPREIEALSGQRPIHAIAVTFVVRLPTNRILCAHTVEERKDS